MDKSQQTISKSSPKRVLFSNTIAALPTNVIFDDTPLESVSDLKFPGVAVDNRR